MPRSRNAQGAIFMTLAMLGFSCGDSISKSVVGEMNTAQFIFIRGAFTSLVVLAIAWRMKAFVSLRLALSPALILRVVCEVLAAITYITALGMIPIANASAILQSLPLVVTLGAALFFNEPVGWRRWMAILVGLAGVLIIIRPGSEGFSFAALLCVGSVLATAGRDLATRSIDPRVPSLMVTSVTAVSVALFGAALTPVFGGWQSVDPTTLSHVALASLLVLVGYQSVILAMRTGEISFVAPFRYTSLIFSAVLGLLFFNEFPDRWTWIGAAIVIASGGYAFYREARRRRHAAAGVSA